MLQYYVLKELVADELGLESGDLIWCIDNAHIYNRHIELLQEQVNSFDYTQPNDTKLILPTGDGFFDRGMSKTKFENYTHNGKYEYEVAI